MAARGGQRHGLDSVLVGTPMHVLPLLGQYRLLANRKNGSLLPAGQEEPRVPFTLAISWPSPPEYPAGDPPSCQRARVDGIVTRECSSGARRVEIPDQDRAVVRGGDGALAIGAQPHGP